MQFNPVSLQLSISNTLEEKGRKNEKKQYVTKTSTQLSMELIFDSTDDGSDVRIKTEKFASFMAPQGQGNTKTPTVVVFEWGTFKFQGLVESYKETLDYFSSSGVPLRASMNLGLASQEKVFERLPSPSQDNQPPIEPVISQPTTGQSVTDTATQAGNPNAGRSIARASGFESLRFPSGPLVIDPAINLRPPAAFATGSLGIGASADISGGIGINAGAEVSAGVGIDTNVNVVVGGNAGADFGAEATVEVGAGVGVGPQAGSQASAGVTASAGAFSQLRRPSTRQPPPARLDVEGLIQRNDAVGLATDQGANFQLGGQASIEGSASLQADVGTQASLRSRIQFQED